MTDDSFTSSPQEENDSFETETTAVAKSEIIENTASTSSNSEAFELKELTKNEDEETYSIKSTEAVLETDKDDLNGVSGNNKGDVTEQQLNPDLASFMAACQEGNLIIVQELISSKRVLADNTFSDGITGLHWAAINNRLSIVKYLNENEYSQADSNALGGDLKATPLHWACRNGLVYIVDYLITNADADPTIRDSQSYNALHLAVHSSNITLVIYILFTCCDAHSNKAIYVDEPDDFNRTSLHWAAYQGDIYSVNALLRFGADVSKVDNSLFLPLHWAFMRGYKAVLKALVEAGSDILAKNDQGKDSFEVAKDMNCYDTWTKVLYECRRSPKNNWAVKRPFLDPKMGKLITFFTPYVTLPICFSVCSLGKGFFIPKLFFAFIIFFGSISVLGKFIIPTYLIENKAIPKSPLLAGVFSGTAFWAVIVWLYAILPNLFIKHFFANLILGGLIASFTWSFIKTMFINPGYVPTPSDNAIIYQKIKDLMGVGKFDTDHFCVNTFNRKPLRSKYSKASNKLVARFDHMCPWVYNEIGVRNHKLFVTFVYSLSLAILFFTYLSMKLFDQLADAYDSDNEEVECTFLSDELCYAYRNNSFHFNVMAWCLLQYVWIFFLSVVQTFQILKGVTSWEFINLNDFMHQKNHNHSTLPRDFPLNQPETPSSSLSQRSEIVTCCRLLGIDQFILTMKLSIASLFNKSSATSNSYQSLNSLTIPTDYGWKQNWLDFWFLGDIRLRNVFLLPIEGENNLNGKVVDYYRLYEYPPRAASELV
ncbi:uncharacterized protein PRCAT00006142001 [Priceomyces carsonii]|uniref:uncharacterized protein n=1 Tax=Priceomyces carsonii TaxID=28549 RepID=UPI002EDAD53B|nr:unnamed protein product [Priceomyces carsonii]